jgi:hypothetical protein
MLKMKEPPNNLLKTEGRKIDPNELLKAKELSVFEGCKRLTNRSRGLRWPLQSTTPDVPLSDHPRRQCAAPPYLRRGVFSGLP